MKAEVNVQLERHQLIKVRATELDRNARKTLFEQMAEFSNAALIGTVGRTALLYRANAEAIAAAAAEAEANAKADADAE